MKTNSDERAPARTAKRCRSNFGRAAADLDRLEAQAGNWPGGPPPEARFAVARAEDWLTEFQPETRADWQWIAGRLARAHANEWCAEAVTPLVRLAGAPAIPVEGGSASPC